MAAHSPTAPQRQREIPAQAGEQGARAGRPGPGTHRPKRWPTSRKLVGDTAAGLDERLGAEYGDYARSAAAAIEKPPNTIAAKDPDELIEDTRDFVRNSPGVALAGAAVVGFALARLLKTGLAEARTTTTTRTDAQATDAKPADPRPGADERPDRRTRPRARSRTARPMRGPRSSVVKAIAAAKAQGAQAAGDPVRGRVRRLRSAAVTALAVGVVDRACDVDRAARRRVSSAC